MWVLYLQCWVLVNAGITISEGLSSSLLSTLALAFPCWVMVYLNSGVLENIARRHVWLRLAENGVLLQPAWQGHDVAHTLRDSWEYRLLCGGLGLMGLALLAVGQSGAVGPFLASASALLLLHKAWVLHWRLPTAVEFLPARAADGAVDVDFVRQLQCVDEARVAAACAALPEGGRNSSSFGALAALVKANAANGADATIGVDGAADGAAGWAARRNWAMRFLGVPTPIAVVLPALHALAGLGLCGAGVRRVELPVRRYEHFKASKDRLFASRMKVWNAVFLTIVLTVHLVLLGGVARSGPLDA